MESGARIVYEFSKFRLDLQQRLLISGADGSPIPLSPRVFDTLLYLVERRGELLDKTTLMKAIWPNIVVEENSLNQNISALRRALGENPGEHRFIVTEPGRGYRFVADVRTVAVPPPSATPRLESATASGATTAGSPATASSARNSIAVLPFANMTGDPAKEYFGDGMAEELIHVLARVPGLRVPSRTSSFAYKGRNVDLRQIASDLRVGAVLEGSVRSAGERIRVTAQLIDAESGYHLWSQSYDRKFEDLFELQDDLAHEIVRTLRASITTDISSALPHTPPTHDLEAYHLYLQAVAMFSAAQFGRASELVQQALARDPQFARALALRASLRAQGFALDLVLPGTLADAQREIGQAMALAPDDHTPYAALGVLCTAQGKWIEAEEAFRNAHARNTTHDPTVLSAATTYLTQSVGEIERSLSQFLELHRLAPAWLVNLLSVAAAYHFLGRHGEAHRFMDLAIQLGMSKTVLFVPDVLAMVAMHDGRHEEAADLMVNALTPMLRDAGGVEAVQSAFTALARRDGYRTAIEKLNRLRARVRLEELTLLGKRRFVLWYTLLGAPTEAFDVANETLDALGRHGTIGTAWGFMWMREMLPFRQDARFQTLCERLKLFDYWKKFGPPDNCELRDGKLICN